MQKLLLVAAILVGLHSRSLKRFSKADFMDEDVMLPKKIQSAGKYCLDIERIDTFVNRIPDPENALPSAFVCAFIAFQRSVLKETPKYNRSNVDERFELFMQCVRDIHRLNSENSTATFGVTLFCDMTEEERLARTDGVITPESKLLGSPGGNTDNHQGESEADPKPGDSDIALPPIIVSGGYIGEDELSLPPTLGASELRERGVVLPLGAESVDRLCATSNGSEVQALSSLAYNVETEDAYLCAFTAFQSSELKVTEPYEDEADAEMRYNLFKICVREVEEINAQNLTWTAAVNLFCDMTEEERFPYSNGVRFSDFELEGATSEDDGFGFGEPMPRVEMPQVEFYIGEDELSHPPILPTRSFNQTEDFDVDACANGDVKKLAAKENKEEEDYVCAFLAFQNSTIKATEPYENEEEADWRYDIFKNSLIEIDRLNEEDNDWSAGITKFVDMNTEERQKNSLGRRNP